MFSFIRFLCFSFFSVLLFSCNEQDRLQIEQSASAFDIKQGEASILQSNQHFMKSIEAGDSVEVADSYTTDAGLMPPHHPTINGRKNIINYFSKTMRNGLSDFDLKTVNVWGDSSILVEEGIYRLSDKKKVQLDKGKYIVLWKQEAGNWKMYRDIWTSDLPISATKPDSTSLPKH
jgi:ketosteroid isomerase-like protein